MSLLRRIARPMIASMFLYGGLDQVRNAQAKVAKAEPVIDLVKGPLHLPDDPALLVRANGAAMMGAGTLFALGRVPRLSALVLTATLVPTTYAGHAFWAETDPAAKATQRLQFIKNVSMLGGLLLAVVDTDGKPGVVWRSKRAGRDAKRAGKLASRDARLLAKAAKREARGAAHEARREAKFAKARVEAHSPL